MSQITTDPNPLDENSNEAAPPAWPKAVGITSIVLGSLGATCGGCGIVWMLFAPSLMKPAIEKMGPMPPDMLPGATQQILGLVGMISPILLVIAGAMTLSRRAAGRSLHLVYAPISIALTAVSIGMGLQQQARLAKWMGENPTSGWAQQSNPVVGYIIMGLIAFVSIGWPLFCLAWFGLMKRRPEQGRFEIPV